MPYCLELYHDMSCPNFVTWIKYSIVYIYNYIFATMLNLIRERLLNLLTSPIPNNGIIVVTNILDFQL